MRRKELKRTGLIALIVIVLSISILYVNFQASATDKGRQYYEERNLIIWDVQTEEKVIALTFDDGPHPIYTAQILDILARFDAKATFFVLGEHAEKYPTIVLRENDEGHEIANHTFTHSYKYTAKELERELLKTNDVIYGITGTYPVLFRPVGGSYDESVVNIAVENDYKVVLWSWHQDTEDWKRPGVRRIVNRVLTGTKPGDVILFHDAGGNRAQTVKALEEILPELQKQGYQFVTVSELIKIKNAETTMPKVKANRPH